MVRGRGHGEILTAAEKESLEAEKRDLQDTLKEKESAGKGTSADQLNEAAIKRQIQNIDKAIKDRAVPRISGLEKDRLVKEEEKLIDLLREGLPTRDEMDFPTKNPGAVRKHMRWLDKNKANIERWRYIQRVVHEDDPRSIENLRKEK